MPESNLERLGASLRAARNDVGLTQEQLSDLSHVSIKHIANIEKGKMNPSYEVLRALATVLKISFDALVYPEMASEEEACKALNASYLSCPITMRGTLLKSTRALADELTALAQNLKIK